MSKEQIITEQPIEIKEETVVTAPVFTAQQEALIAALMAGGATREMAIAQMNALAAMNPVEAIKETPAPAPQPEAPKAEEKKKEAKKDKKEKSENKEKPWFKKAVGKMNIFSKSNLMSELILMKIDEKDPKVKAEIAAEIEKLKGKDGDARFDKMKGYISKTKGWTVDATGKVADALYVTGDYTEKAAKGATELVGKATKAVGTSIVKTGEFIENGAETVGKVARMPMDAAGDLINIANGTKKVEKKEDKKDSKKK